MTECRIHFVIMYSTNYNKEQIEKTTLYKKTVQVINLFKGQSKF